MARLASAARHHASDLGYRVTGMRGFDTVEPHRAVGWFQLTRGSVVVWTDGPQDALWTWHATLAEAEPHYRQVGIDLRAGA